MKALLSIAGLVLTAMGALFALQGSGFVRWPAESFMIGQRAWIEYGVVILLVGIAMLFAARRIDRT
jgi:hypothetical protein